MKKNIIKLLSTILLLNTTVSGSLLNSDYKHQIKVEKIKKIEKFVNKEYYLFQIIEKYLFETADLSTDYTLMKQNIINRYGMYDYEWKGYNDQDITFSIINFNMVEITNVISTKNLKEYNAYKFSKLREHSAIIYENKDSSNFINQVFVNFPLSPSVNTLLININDLSSNNTISENPPLDKSKPWIKIIGNGNYITSKYSIVLDRWQIIEDNENSIYIEASEVADDIQNYIGVEGQIADYRDIDNKIHEYIYISGVWYPTTENTEIVIRSCEDGNQTTVDLLINDVCVSNIASCLNGFSGTVDGTLDGTVADNALNCSNLNITDLDLLNYINLISVSEDLWLFNNDLTNVDGLASLESVDGSLVLNDNTSLTNLDGLSSLVTVTDGITLNNNVSLTNIDGLSSLTSSGVFVADNTGLTNVNGLSGLTETTSYFSLSDNEKLVDITGLSSLTTVSGDFWIQSNSNLTNLDGLNNLTNLSGSLLLDKNLKLENINGLVGLTTINGSLKLGNNLSLQNVDGLSNVTNIDGLIELYNVPSLTDLSGLNNANISSTLVPSMFIDDKSYTTKLDSTSPICVGARDGTLSIAIVSDGTFSFPTDKTTGYDFMCN